MKTRVSWKNLRDELGVPAGTPHHDLPGGAKKALRRLVKRLGGWGRINVESLPLRSSLVRDLGAN